MQYFENSQSIKLKTLDTDLKSTIFGQDHAIDAVVDMLTINTAGLGDDNKPIASFLFTGPTGVGKTELVITLAKSLGMHFERFDMSEYADDYSYRNLIGAQKGLVGYDEGGLLTNAIDKNPSTILLLDEIEKAHPAIYDTFLQVLDYATLKDSSGQAVSFKKTIIIMTSNLDGKTRRGIGFGSSSSKENSEELSLFLRPEFRNRIDKILHFNTLSSTMIVSVVEKFVGDLKERLLKKRIVLTISELALNHLIKLGFDEGMGARSVKRAINDEFKKYISREMLFGKLTYGGKVTVDIKDEAFTYEFEENKSDTPRINQNSLYDFSTAEEAMAYAKNNPGVAISRSADGTGYSIKKKVANHAR